MTTYRDLRVYSAADVRIDPNAVQHLLGVYVYYAEDISDFENRAPGHLENVFSSCKADDFVYGIQRLNQPSVISYTRFIGVPLWLDKLLRRKNELDAKDFSARTIPGAPFNIFDYFNKEGALRFIGQEVFCSDRLSDFVSKSPRDIPQRRLERIEYSYTRGAEHCMEYPFHICSSKPSLHFVPTHILRCRYIAVFDPAYGKAEEGATELTVSEIAERLGIENLKIVKEEPSE